MEFWEYEHIKGRLRKTMKDTKQKRYKTASWKMSNAARRSVTSEVKSDRSIYQSKDFSIYGGEALQQGRSHLIAS